MTERFDPFVTPMASLDDLLVVSASAGTGKTWMIAHLASRWLLEGDRDPAQLLLVTFSRASAAELKTRLRQRLREIQAVLAAGPSDSDSPGDGSGAWRAWLAGLVAAVGADTIAARLEHALSSLDDVHARTIHSFATVVRPVDDDARVTAERAPRERAAREALTRRAVSEEPGLLGLLDAVEAGSSRQPASVRLEQRIVGALNAAEAVGGWLSGRVELSTRVDEQPLDEVAASLVRDAAARLAVTRAASSTVTFDSLIAELHRDVTRARSPLAQQLRDQFALVLIDEFQDTDQLQWEIFDAVFRRGTPTRPVVVVGDPKQAIYGFRGGDVSVFARVHGELSAPTTPRRSFALDLSVNHRATEGLLAATNWLFLAGDANGWRFTDEPDAVRYEPVLASDQNRGAPGHLSLRARGEHGDLTREDDVVAVLRELLSVHGVAPREIAVLCRQRARIAELHRRLDRAGVRAVSVGSGSVFDSVAATQLAALLWVLASPEDPRRANLVAGTWFAALKSADLVTLSEAMARRGVAAGSRIALDALVTQTAIGAFAERHWTDLVHLFDLLGREHPGPVTADAVLRTLHGRRFDDDGTGDEINPATRRIESDEDAVTLMTIHRAKGLQYPVVLVPEIETRFTRPRLASWTTDRGVAIDASSLYGAPATPSPAAARDAAEARRLIYVALTRAERLTVAWVDRADGQWPDLVAAAERSVPTAPAGAPLSAPTFQRYGDALAAAGDLGLTPAAPRTSAPPTLAGDPPHIDSSLARWSFSALRVPGIALFHDDLSDADDASVVAPVIERPGDDGGTYLDVFDGRRGAALGSAVHAVFEHVVGQVRAADKAQLAEHARTAWLAHGLSEPGPGVSDVFARLLTRPLGPLFDGADLDSLVGPARTSSELRFTLPLRDGVSDRLAPVAAFVAAHDAGGPFAEFFGRVAAAPTPLRQLARGFLTGSLDLVAAIGDPARYVVVDYKTNLLPGGRYEPPDLTAAMAESGYPVQGLLYLVALHRFLRGRLAGYDADTHLGGLGYYYLRGAARPVSAESGLAIWRPSGALVAGVSDLFDGREP